MELPSNSSTINISDVIEVIETDCNKMDVGRQEKPYIKILEQPAPKTLRFRYECEGRSAGSIPGVNSTPENKTYPTIQIVGYQGRAVVVVSCVTKDSPHKPHPHNLVGREGCKKGVCTVDVHNETMTQSFDHLGIQCVKKKDIEAALKIREEIRVDPFRTGFNHRSQPGTIDLNAVRLCFQAFLEDTPGRFKLALMPVVSDIVYDKKALCDLSICKLSHCSAPVAGGLEMILLCEKVAKEDISVRLFEEKNGQVVWEGQGDFTPTQVHKQYAITFKTPKYKTLEVDGPVQVLIQLRRPSDGETSLALPFQLTPLDSGSGKDELSRKKPKITHEIKNTDIIRVPTSQISPGLGIKRESGNETSPNPYVMCTGGPSHSAYRTPSPIHQTSSKYIVFQSNSGLYPSSTSPLNMVNPQIVSVNPPLEQAAGGNLSAHPTYTILGDSRMFSPNVNIETLHSNYPDISSSIHAPSLQGGANGLMENITINSKDFPDYLNISLDEKNLSENLSINLSLNCDSSQVKKAVLSQENMTDSFTKFVNNAYNDFEG